MMRWSLMLVGALAMVAGAVWTLQGLDLLGGSPMSGNRIWAVVGPVVAVVGVALLAAGVRRRGRPGP
jgi:hypothetical protein